MIGGVLITGVVVALVGAVAAAALLSLSRLELARAVSGQLRGGPGSLSWLIEMEQYLAVAGALTAVGLVLLGASIPAVFADLSRIKLALVLVLVVLPGVLLAVYLLPRRLAGLHAERLRAALLPLLRPLARLLGLVLPARPLPGPHDLRTIWREGTSAGLGADEELVMVGGVMTFAERPVRELMTPRTDLVAVGEGDALEDITQVFAQSGYSRLPVYRGTLDEIVGMLHAFDLFRLRPGDRLPIRPVAVAPASRSAGDLLLDMQRERRHLAVVLDEFGGTAGIITLEDLLEALVGQIYDEHDEPAAPVPAPRVTLLEADGATPLDRLEEQFELHLPRVRTSTVGGLLAELTGRIPQAGERYLIAGLEVEIVQASLTRIERVLIRRGSMAPVVLVPVQGPEGRR